MFAAENHGGRHGLRRHRHAARARAAARQHGLLVPRRLAERAERVPAGEGTRADAAVHVQPERHAAQGADVVLAVGDRRVALRLGEHLRRTRRTARAAAPVRRPSDRINFNGRLDHALNKSHTLRANLQQNGNDQRNLGVGGFDLPDRAYSRDDATTRMLRLSESGPWSRRRVRRDRGCRSAARRPRRRPTLEAPTVRVLDAFTAGGAQQAGGRDSHRHRVGDQRRLGQGQTRDPLRHAGRGRLVPTATTAPTISAPSRSRASRTTRPAGRRTTRSASAIRCVEYSQWQAGLFVQDDWRARKNLTLSGGLRQELQTHLDDDWNLAPRGGLHLVAVQERQDDRARRRRHLLRLARRGHLRADAARRRRAPAATW